MKKWSIFLFIGCFVFFIAGCMSDSTTIENLEKEIVELEKQVEEIKQQNEKPNDVEIEEDEEKEIIVDEKPISIQLIDPNTNEPVLSFQPEELGYHTDINSYKKEIEEIAKNLARGTEKNIGYDQRMKLDKLDENGEIIKGAPMIILKESELVEKILSVSAKGGEVLLPIYVTESSYDRDEVHSLDDFVVATYTTYFDPSVSGRNKNIELSAQAIDRIIIGNNDYFSFNTTVGPRTEETGYKSALEIINGEFVMGIGGGICQTSSTLFNAVDQLGVKLVERHHHSLSVGYVPEGRDATVSYGSLDFRFQNTTGVPLLITTKYTENSVTIEIRTSEQYATTL